MLARKNIQLLHEMDSWCRSLEYYKQEIVHLKNRLTQIMDDHLEPEFLQEVEYFHNKLINKDIVIDFLRNEIISQKTLLAKRTDDGVITEFIVKHERIRNDMTKMEINLNNLKTEFNSWITEKLEV